MTSSSPPSAGSSGLWQWGWKLVMSRAATLPPRCVKCGEAASERLRTTVWTYHPLSALFFLPLLFFLKSAVVDLPICARHRSRRRWLTWLGAALWAPSLVVLLMASLLIDGHPGRAGWITLVILLGPVGVLVVLVGRRHVTADRIDKNFVWLKGVHRTVVQELPLWPGGS